MESLSPISLLSVSPSKGIKKYARVDMTVWKFVQRIFHLALFSVLLLVLPMHIQLETTIRVDPLGSEGWPSCVHHLLHSVFPTVFPAYHNDVVETAGRPQNDFKLTPKWVQYGSTEPSN